MEEAKNWYTLVLGFGPYFDEPFYIGFNVAGYELGLQPMENTVKTPSETVNIYWGVADIDAEFQRLLQLGATSFEEPTDVGEGIKTAMLRDPWGNLLGIILNPHFSLPG
jgi:lactoylglutathione lyase